MVSLDPWFSAVPARLLSWPLHVLSPCGLGFSPHGSWVLTGNAPRANISWGREQKLPLLYKQDWKWHTYFCPGSGGGRTDSPSLWEGGLHVFRKGGNWWQHLRDQLPQLPWLYVDTIQVISHWCLSASSETAVMIVCSVGVMILKKAQGDLNGQPSLKTTGLTQPWTPPRPPPKKRCRKRKNPSLGPWSLGGSYSDVCEVLFLPLPRWVWFPWDFLHVVSTWGVRVCGGGRGVRVRGVTRRTSWKLRCKAKVQRVIIKCGWGQ